MSHWTLSYDRFEPEQEMLREALCTLGNGYFATRGAACESSAGKHHYPGTYLAGGYDRAVSEIAGRQIENEDLVNLPNWLPLSFRIDAGAWFDLHDVQILHYRQSLDLRHGVLTRSVRFKDDDGRETMMEERRFVHMGRPHLAGQELRIRACDWSGRLELRAMLDGRVTNAGVARYQDLEGRHLEPMEARFTDDRLLFLKMQTCQSELRVAQAARLYVEVDGQAMDTDVEGLVGDDQARVEHRQTVMLRKGQTCRVEKVASLYSSRDPATSEAGAEALHETRVAPSFADLLKAHRNKYDLLWQAFDLDLQTTSPSERHPLSILRLHLFHMMQTVSPHTIDLDVGVPARGWHGEAYRGHIFWDELFILPTFNMRLPDITRSLLRYRHRRLKEARRRAAAAGHAGASYPWQSGSNGREESQTMHLNPRSGNWNPDNSHLQRHVDVAIAFNVWNYYRSTQDLEFLTLHGAELFLEIARFWASMATFDDQRQRYVVRGVMGPDEYHDGYPWRDEPGLDNNAYTNVMAAWVLHTACALLDVLPNDRRPGLVASLGIRDPEVQRWRDISRRMYVPFHGAGIISQFEGYEKLQPFDWQGYRERYGDIQRLDRILEAENDTPNRYQASKQADVLMLFYLFSATEVREIFERLGYTLDVEQIRRNIDYYEQRSAHGSTLSWVVHAWVLARYHRGRSWSLFLEALRSDVEDIQGGTTHEGIHLGAMAGTVDLMQRGFTGLEVHRDRLAFRPVLPDEVQSLRMKVHYQGHLVGVELDHERLVLSSCDCPGVALPVEVKGQRHVLHSNETSSFAI